MKITWELATLQSCLKEVCESDMKFTRKNLIKNHLDNIVEKTGSIGKTPSATMSRTLQQLRDLGLIEFITPGIYELKPCKFRFQKEEKMSKGELLVSRLLDNLNIKYEREKSFVDLKHKSYLRFDFYFEIDGKGFAVEFDGVQHKRPVDFFGGEEGYQDLKMRDKLKEEYCIKKKIKLIRIDEINYNKAKTIVVKSIYEELIKSEKEHEKVKSCKRDKDVIKLKRIRIVG